MFIQTFNSPFKMESLDTVAEGAKEIKIIVGTSGKEYIMKKSYAEVSSIMKSQFEIRTQGNSNDDLTVKLADFTPERFHPIYKFLMHQKGTDCKIPPKPLNSKDMKQICDDPEVARMIDELDDNGRNRAGLYALIMDCNYLGIQGLLHVACAKVASIIAGEPLSKVTELLKPGPVTADHEK
jgi:hypothetical protein